MIRLLFIIALCCFSLQLIAQETEVDSDLTYAEQLLALEDELDSLSIFNFLDSLLLSTPSIKSEMSLRFGFTSSVTSAGRDYDINQTGQSYGLGYFHKSGFYGDLSGYWNSNVTPTYNPTILSTGYLGSLSKKWSYSFDYEHWFYNPKDSSLNELTNSLGTSLTYDFNIGYLSFDYSYLFGKSSSQRIIGSLTGTMRFGKFAFFKQVSMFPTASIMAGNGDITTLRITIEQISRENRFFISRVDSLSNLSDEQLQSLLRFVNTGFRNGNISRERRDYLVSLITTAATITDEELAELNAIAENGIQQEEFVDGEEFGILNYSFTLPISFSTNRLSLMLSYTYSIPVKLEGEFFDVEPLGYFAASISYRIPYK